MDIVKNKESIISLLFILEPQLKKYISSKISLTTSILNLLIMVFFIEFDIILIISEYDFSFFHFIYLDIFYF